MVSMLKYGLVMTFAKRNIINIHNNGMKEMKEQTEVILKFYHL